MTPEQIQELVDHEITTFKHVEPAPGSTIGKPWSEDKVLSYIAELKCALVTPYKQTFAIRDTMEQISKPSSDEAEYWVVAESGRYIEFYDPLTKEFGLAERVAGEGPPVTIGVRGDLVGTFCAM